MKFLAKFSFLSLFLTLIIYLFFVYPPSDFDFGWHLRYGEYFWQNHRLLRENIFSYTLPNYLWVNHSWSYDLWFYPLFRYLGFLGVALVGPLFILLTLKVFFKSIRASPGEQLLGTFLVFFLGTHSLNEGLRSRFPVFVFLAILYLWLNEIKNGQRKYLFYLPLLFLIWANIHGQFSVGLFYLSLVWLVFAWDAFRQPKKYFKNWLLLGGAGLASGLTTLINPFGTQVVNEAIKHAVNPNLRLVVEYFAPDFNDPYGLGLIIYTTLLVAALVFLRNPTFLKEAIPLIPFAYLSFQARRNMIFFALLSCPLAIKILRPYLTNLSKKPYFGRLFSLVLAGTFVALIFRFIPFNLVSYNWAAYCQFSSGCSEGATAYLKQNLPRGRGFTLYDWGGYLIWRLPEIKTFIDGRMHLWQIQGHYIMEEHEKLITASGDWDKVFHDLDFAWALLPPNSNLAQRLEALAQAKIWEKVYQDEKATIYLRRIPPP